MAFRKVSPRTIILGIGAPIEVDAVLSENHKSSRIYTRYPVEFGRLGSDHSQKQPDELEMTILITDTPVGKPSFEGRHRAIYSQLVLWQELGLPVIVSTGLRSYINMYIEDLSPSKQPRDGRGIKVNIKFVEVEITLLGLGSLLGTLAVDNNIAHGATNLLPIGIV